MTYNQAIDQMITNIMNGNNSDAQNDFRNVMADKIHSAIEAKKTEVSQNLYGTNVATEIEDHEDTQST
jgi:hypothetical protein